MLTGGKPQGFVEAMKGVYSSMRLCQVCRRLTLLLCILEDGSLTCLISAHSRRNYRLSGQR